MQPELEQQMWELRFLSEISKKLAGPLVSSEVEVVAISVETHAVVTICRHSTVDGVRLHGKAGNLTALRGDFSPADGPSRAAAAWLGDLQSPNWDTAVLSDDGVYWHYYALGTQGAGTSSSVPPL